jgi:hypothetical protein
MPAGGDWTFGLWLAVIASGLYHGINPGMGWPLAVSAGLVERRTSALFKALGMLAVGHFAAMAVILLPFGLLTTLVAWSRQIQIAASLLVIGFGVFLFFYRRHPRVLARIPPTKLALWSFAIAIAHGAGLMLVPIYLGLCTTAQPSDPGHQAAIVLASNNLAMALAVSALHTVAMIAIGGVIAWSVYRYLGVQILSKLWINLDGFWALSLIAVGTAALLGNL